MVKLVNERAPGRTYGRVVIEDVLLPAVRERPNTQRILFVGLLRRTRDYPNRFPGREFSTMDIDPEVAQFGAEHHIVDSVVNIRRHFGPDGLDAVICVGVLGAGLNSRQDIETTIAGFAECLRPGGLLILSRDNHEAHPAPPLEEIEALSRFDPVVLPPLVCPVYPTFREFRPVYHTYERSKD